MEKPVTDEQIREVVRKYILDGHESDNADCMHEMDEFSADSEDIQQDLKRAYEIYRAAIVTVTWE